MKYTNKIKHLAIKMYRSTVAVPIITGLSLGLLYLGPMNYEARAQDLIQQVGNDSEIDTKDLGRQVEKITDSLKDSTNMINDVSDMIVEQTDSESRDYRREMKGKEKLDSMSQDDIFLFGLQAMYGNAKLNQNNQMTYTTEKGNYIIFQDNNHNNQIDGHDSLYVTGMLKDLDSRISIDAVVTLSDKPKATDLVKNVKVGVSPQEEFALAQGREYILKPINAQSEIIYSEAIRSGIQALGIDDIYGIIQTNLNFEKGIAPSLVKDHKGKVRVNGKLW